MKVFVFYDIVDNKTRSRLITLLEDFSMFRIQNSVFLGELSSREYRLLSELCEVLIDLEEDSLYLVPACSEDYHRAMFVTKSKAHQILEKEVIFF